MNLLDNFLNKFTMYKIVLFGLFFLVIISFIYSFFGVLFYSPIELVFSLFLLLISGFLINYIFSKFFKVSINPESSIITSLILFFILIPSSKIGDVWIYVLASLLAIGSKYLLALNKKHIFNPAALSLTALGLLGIPFISWWIGNSDLFIFVLLVGLIIIRKVRKFQMFLVYFLFALISISIFAFINNREIISVLKEATLSYPILFLGAVMLIEPFTSPPKIKTQIIYASIVGFLSGAQYNFGFIHSSPELALLIGNIYAYSVSFRKRLELQLLETKKLAENIYEFVFTKPDKFSYISGEYLEWTLGGFRPDIRGSRRFFTISSSPTEKNIKIGIRIGDRPSAFKKKLLHLTKGDKIYANNLAGDFVLRKNKKYVFIAGGIGITPFRSMIKSAIDKNEKLDAVLFYSCSKEGEFVYSQLFETARNLGVKTIYICSNPSIKFSGLKGRIDVNLLKNEVPDYKNRYFYLSGPNTLVSNFKKELIKLKITPKKIITDYFSGY